MFCSSKSVSVSCKQFKTCLGFSTYSCSREIVSIHKFTSTEDGKLSFKQPVSLSKAYQPFSTCPNILLSLVFNITSYCGSRHFP